jgi:PBP1b-binding outer membrane lipoprotein LpoB
MYKYLQILCLAVLLSGCFDSDPIEESKQLCLKENKNFYVAEILNYRTGKYEPRVICQ